MIVNLIIAAITGGALLLFGLFLWVVIDVLVTGRNVKGLP